MLFWHWASPRAPLMSWILELSASTFPHEWIIYSISAKQIQGFPTTHNPTLECPLKHRVHVADFSAQLPSGVQTVRVFCASPVHQNKYRLCRKHVCLQQLTGNYLSIHYHRFCPKHRNIQTGFGSSPWEWRSHTGPCFTATSSFGLQEKKERKKKKPARFPFFPSRTTLVYLPPPAAWRLPPMTSWPLFSPGNAFHPWESCCHLWLTCL